MSEQAIFDSLREKYHKSICGKLLSVRGGYANIADKSSHSSRLIAQGIIDNINHPLCKKPPSSQTIGAVFSRLTMNYLNDSFAFLNHIRPGNWQFSASQNRAGIAAFDQYKHLIDLSKLAKKYKELAAILGGDYIIIPDIIIARSSISDAEINRDHTLIKSGTEIGKYTPLRSANTPDSNAILHASISCKWTIRSDRTQNTRTEALNLIRNRKGNTPHIVAVVAEPLPSRIASIALGIGDIDCVYHFALPELSRTLSSGDFQDQNEILTNLISSRRLRDISDLVFDLAI
jgi:hypothetical protein